MNHKKLIFSFKTGLKKGIEVFDPDLTKVWEEHKRNVIIGYNNVRQLDDNRFKYKNLSHFYEQLNINTYTKNHHINICGVVERDQIHVKNFFDNYKFDKTGSKIILPVWVKEMLGRRTHVINGNEYNDSITSNLNKIKDLLTYLNV